MIKLLRNVFTRDRQPADLPAEAAGAETAPVPSPAPKATPAASSPATTAARGQQEARNAGGRPKSGAARVQHPPRPHPAREPHEKPDWTIADFDVPAESGKVRFHDFNLPPSLMRGIQACSFRYCTPIQAEVLGHTLAGHDAIGRAQTGTGKTAAFLITIINDLLTNPLDGPQYAGEPRALIVAPTRELAAQIANDAIELCRYCNLNVMPMVGGMDFDKQRERVRREAIDILVATPGRLLDFASRRELYLDQVETLVLDEADRMLDMGFIPDVKRIVRMTPSSEYRQTLLFSATFSDDIMNLARRWTFEPAIVEIEPENVATDTVEQKVYMCTTEEKFRVLYNMLIGTETTRVIIFANRRDQTRRLSDLLRDMGIRAALLSGDVPQEKRMKTLEKFRGGELDALVATDVAGRGIHIDGVSHVVNFTLPEDPEDYVHRIGRTGRAGASGISVSFADEDDGFAIPGIEKLLGRKLVCVPPPEELLAATPPRQRRDDDRDEERSAVPARHANRSGGRSSNSRGHPGRHGGGARRR
ncbi:MAG: ATP-dependent RNA helicase RhlB [Gammaproteobacteria bacterium]